MPVIEVRVTSARDYRAGWPTRVVLSEERNAGVLSSSPQREHSAARRVNDLPLTITPSSMHTHTGGRLRVYRRRRSRMTSFLLIAGVGARARGLPLDSYVRHAIPRL